MNWASSREREREDHFANLPDSALFSGEENETRRDETSSKLKESKSKRAKVNQGLMQPLAWMQELSALVYSALESR